jgi:glutathione S-transferase
MITLYGVAISNYFNKVKLALLHKDIAFEEVLCPPSQEEQMLAISPMGKIPYIKVDDQYITESTAIIEYLEQAYPEAKKLFPENLLEAARAREIISYIDLYFDSQIRRIIGSAFFGAPKNEAAIDEVEVGLKKAVDALKKIITFKPYINSEEIGIVDYSAITTMTLTSATMLALGRTDPLTEIDGLADYYKLVHEDSNVKSVEASKQQALEQFMQRSAE